MNVTLVRPWVRLERPRGKRASKRRSKPGQPSTEGDLPSGGNNKPAWRRGVITLKPRKELGPTGPWSVFLERNARRGVISTTPRYN
eukprot:scaffold57368_cov36-Phaeocystis_antarctica.AAC.2